MKVRSGRTLDAVGRPGTTEGREVSRSFGMPVAAGEDRHVRNNRALHVLVEHGHDRVTVGNRERATWAEVLLHIHHDQRIWHDQPLLLQAAVPPRVEPPAAVYALTAGLNR